MLVHSSQPGPVLQGPVLQPGPVRALACRRVPVVCVRGTGGACNGATCTSAGYTGNTSLVLASHTVLLGPAATQAASGGAAACSMLDLYSSVLQRFLKSERVPAITVRTAVPNQLPPTVLCQEGDCIVADLRPPIATTHDF